MTQYRFNGPDVGAIIEGTHEIVVEPGHHRWAEFLAAAPAYVPGPEAPSLDDYRVAVQDHLDDAARARRYDSGATMATYAADPNPAWAAEAQAFVAWRSAVWAHVYALEAAVIAGEAQPPSVANLIAGLPTADWP